MGKRKKNKRKRKKGRGSRDVSTATDSDVSVSTGSGVQSADSSASDAAPSTDEQPAEQAQAPAPVPREQPKAEFKPKTESKPKQSGGGGGGDDYSPRTGGAVARIKAWWLEWAYKSKRGPMVRWGSVGVFYFLTVFGLHNMWVELDGTAQDNPDSIIHWWSTDLAVVPVPAMDDEIYITIGLLVTIALCIALGCALLWLFWKRPDVSEFMIDTETEMMKVSWPPWDELKSSTVATVIATLLLGLYLFFVDMVLSSLFEMIIRIDS